MTAAADIELRAPRAESCNVACHLPAMAARAPHRAAVVVSAGRDSAGLATYNPITFQELEALSNRFAQGLGLAGIDRGTRVLLMVRPGVEFIGLVFALLKMAAAPILIDPGMGLRRLLQCVRQVRPEALVGIPAAHILRRLRPGAFRTVRSAVTVGRGSVWGGAPLPRLTRGASERFAPAETQPTDVAAFLFTSGSTGPAKGVVYEHGMFDAQVKAIQRQYGIAPGEVDLPTFPLFALFNPALGMTSVIPDMDPAHPARADPARIVQAIEDQRVTNSFGSPALWERVSRYCQERRIVLSTLKRVLIAGAPVPWRLVERMQSILPANGEVHTPYGATESLPVASISGRELIPACAERTRAGAGICVGRPVAATAVRIIRIADEPIPRWSDDLVVPDGQIGEIAVRGDVVTQAYDALPDATLASKIANGSAGSAGNGRLWHRMGDVGYFDADGRLWFCGRKAHRVITGAGPMFTIPCEAIINEHPDVNRSALVGVGPRHDQRPVIVVELPAGLRRSAREKARLKAEILELARRNPITASIQDVLFHRSFPVDVRHNAKINREALAIWAAHRVRSIARRS